MLSRTVARVTVAVTLFEVTSFLPHSRANTLLRLPLPNAPFHSHPGPHQISCTQIFPSVKDLKRILRRFSVGTRDGLENSSCIPGVQEETERTSYAIVTLPAQIFEDFSIDCRVRWVPSSESTLVLVMAILRFIADAPTRVYRSILTSWEFFKGIPDRSSATFWLGRVLLQIFWQWGRVHGSTRIPNFFATGSICENFTTGNSQILSIIKQHPSSPRPSLWASEPPITICMPQITSMWFTYPFRYIHSLCDNAFAKAIYLFHRQLRISIRERKAESNIRNWILSALCHLDPVKGQQRRIRLLTNYRCPQLRKQFNSNELGHFPLIGYIALWIVSHGIRILARRFLAPILLYGGPTFVSRISRLAKISSPWEKAQGLPSDHARHGDSLVT